MPSNYRTGRLRRNVGLAEEEGEEPPPGVVGANPWAQPVRPRAGQPLPPAVPSSTMAEESARIRAEAQVPVPQPVGGWPVAPSPNAYGGPPRPYVMPASIRQPETVTGGLQVEVPRAPMPYVPPGSQDAGPSGGLPAVSWQRAGAPGMAPVIAPEAARPLAVTEPPRPVPVSAPSGAVVDMRERLAGGALAPAQRGISFRSRRRWLRLPPRTSRAGCSGSRGKRVWPCSTLLQQERRRGPCWPRTRRRRPNAERPAWSRSRARRPRTWATA
ncbi:MAG: hypothetical protein FD189_1120 [Elusimicrobia bacterium]|nr:MAG: hypothetical protein FD189_1120 [Elusimicrobiota bacterium]